MQSAILGAGVIGAGWAARFLLHGWDVALWDPNPQANAVVELTTAKAAEALTALYDRPLPRPGTLSVHPTAADAVKHADWVQESAPEELSIKRTLYASISTSIDSNTPVASSTSGFRPTQLAQDSGLDAQFLVCHPFNPVYLLPGVELVPGSHTRQAITDTAETTLRAIGMLPTVVRTEIDAHIADRLLEAVWREALWLVKDDVATTGEIDQIIRSSFGLRWAQMGLFETYQLGGGTGGFQHFLKQFGPALHWPWSRLTDVPELDDALVAKIVAQCEAETGSSALDTKADQRDKNLVALLRALKDSSGGVGPELAAFEALLPNVTDNEEQKKPGPLDPG